MIKEMIKILFPDTKNIDEVVSIIEKYRMKFGLNTDLRIAHFLAQAREEIGSNFKPISENLNYSSTSLPKIFVSTFGRNKELANTYGRTKYQKANQEMIANIAYANRLGNGDIESGDGWNYRGRFSLQITGRSNYEQVQIRINRYAPECNVDIVNGDKDNLEALILAGFGYWIWHDLYRLADKGLDDNVVDSITSKINYHTHSYQSRVQHFRKIKYLINI